LEDPHRSARPHHDRRGLAPISCVDTQLLPARFAGREFDEDQLGDFPPGIDPCAERGEFHTCVYAGPMFSAPLSLAAGEIVTRGRFVFADSLLPQS
jgi:diphthamide synthase (EF-2-diphthine--ammonia ligase)